LIYLRKSRIFLFSSRRVFDRFFGIWRTFGARRIFRFL